MNKRLSGIIAVLCAVGALIVMVLFQRDPWAAHTDPLRFVFDDLRIVSAADGTPADLDVLVGLEKELLEELTIVARAEFGQSYILSDPDANIVTIHIAGGRADAVFPSDAAAVAFDTTALGGEPVSLLRDPGDVAYFITGPVGGIGDDLAFRVRFVPADTDAIAQVSQQEQDASARNARLDAWHADMDRIQSLVEAGPAFSGPVYDLRLPGWQASATVPLWAYPGLWPDFPRTEFDDLNDPFRYFTVLAFQPGKASAAFAAQKERAVQNSAEKAVFIDTDTTYFAVPFEGQGVFLHHETIGLLDYVVFMETAAWADLLDVWAFADSLRPDPLSPQGLAFGTDVLAALDAAGTPVALNAFSKEQAPSAIAALFEVTNLMATWPPAQLATVGLSMPINGEGFPHLEAQMTCTVTQEPQDKASAYHPILAGAGSSLAAGGHAQYDVAHHVQSGAFARQEPWGIAQEGERLRDAPIWFEETNTFAFGTEGALFFLYTVQDVGPFQLICGFANERAHAVLAAQQLVARFPLPDISDLPPEATQLFRSSEHVRTFGPGYYLLSDAGNISDGRMIRPDGEIIFEAGIYDGFWWYADAGVIQTQIGDTYGLWTADGEVLLAHDYGDFDELADGIIKVWDGEKHVYYSVPERDFVPAPQ